LTPRDFRRRIAGTMPAGFESEGNEFLRSPPREAEGILRGLSRGRVAQLYAAYHYSFVEYQGSNLMHWTFDEKDQSAKIKASYLCGHSFLIADGDVSDKGNRRSDYENMLGDRFHILECKEIENLIPAEVLKELVNDEFKKADQGVEKINYAKYSTSDRGLGKYPDALLGKEKFASGQEH
jgi:hypothetical protein